MGSGRALRSLCRSDRLLSPAEYRGSPRALRLSLHVRAEFAQRLRLSLVRAWLSSAALPGAGASVGRPGDADRLLDAEDVGLLSAEGAGATWWSYRRDDVSLRRGSYPVWGE